MLTVLLDVVLPMACVAACATIGRHYERRCAEHRAFCDDMEHSAYRFATMAEHRHGSRHIDAETEPLLRTHDPLYAGRATGRHALREERPPESARFRGTSTSP